MGRFLAVAVATLCFSTLAYATHIPETNVPIVYDGTLVPGVATTGAIGFVNPVDGYDWYCFNVTAGTPVSITVARVSGDIVPNTGIMNGLAEAGGFATLTQLSATGNDTQATTTLNYTPTITGPVTIWVSTFLGEDGGNYTVQMTGGTAGSCTGNATPSTDLLQVLYDPTYNLNPFVTGNGTTSTVPLSTQINAASFNSNVRLSVTTDAEPWENVTATVSPSTLAKPGSGVGAVSITTGAMTFPRVYRATVRAEGLNDNGTLNGVVDEASLLFEVQCTPPFILGTDQPKNLTAQNGTQVQLEVKPSGSGPFFYQWFNGYPGQTGNPVQAANESKLIFTTRASNTYWVRVTNACGTVSSLPVTVTTLGTLSNVRRRSGGN